jgi:acyl-coenzyme A synthetase/AMP-(fatty) acid ligase
MELASKSFNQVFGNPDRDCNVAWTPDHTVSWRDFLGKVEGLSNRLNEEPIPKFTLVCEDSLAFSVGFLAACKADKIAVLPPNTETETVRETAGDTEGIVTEDDELKSVSDRSLDPLEFDGNAEDLGEFDTDKVFAELLTSGSTGERKQIPKTLDNFWADARYYEGIWGDQVGDAVVFSSISHQHIFGLLFKVLWPLAAGRPFYPGTPVYPGDLSNLLDQVDKACFVSSPSPLARFVRSGEMEHARGTLTVIFSGGGQIENSVSNSVRDELGFFPVSVFGTTETGGIAWRLRDPSKDRPGWNLFPNVEIRINDMEELHVRSPRVSNTLDEWYATGDLAEELANEQFVLKGRADRIIKIAENRVSLPQVENKLESSELVGEAIVTTLDEDGANQRKTELGAAVEVTEIGRQRLDESREDVRQKLRSTLEGVFESVALPRKWVFVEELPRDHMSKISQEQVEELFEKS